MFLPFQLLFLLLRFPLPSTWIPEKAVKKILSLVLTITQVMTTEVFIVVFCVVTTKLTKCYRYIKYSTLTELPAIPCSILQRRFKTLIVSVVSVYS